MTSRNLNFIPRKNGGMRLLQTGAALAVLGAVAMGATIFKYGGNSTATITDTLASASFSELPVPSVLAKPKAVSEHEVVSVALGISSDTVRYYEQGSGKAFILSLSTQRTEVVSDKRLPGFLFSHWVPLSQQVISAFQKPTGTEYRFYDYTTPRSEFLGSNLS